MEKEYTKISKLLEKSHDEIFRIFLQLFLRNNFREQAAYWRKFNDKTSRSSNALTGALA